VDLNVVVLAGRLAAEPELREFESGSRLIRYLITVRSSEPRRRVDVLPVTLWDPAPDVVSLSPLRGDRIWAAGTVQRRFWDGGEGRRSTVELIAHHVDLGEVDTVEGNGAG
jgi:single-stranded DNA-binding protein